MDTTINEKIRQAAKLSQSQEEIIMNYQEESNKKITFDSELKDEMKRREQEQTQELLVGLANELFERVEKMSVQEKPNVKKLAKDKTHSQKRANSKKKSKIEFTDLSWYKAKLDSKQEKNREY